MTFSDIHPVASAETKRLISEVSSLQEANTRLEAERDQAENDFLRLWDATNLHVRICRSKHVNQLRDDRIPLMGIAGVIRQRKGQQ